MNKKKHYFKNEDSVECYTREVIKAEMKAEKLTEIEVLEAIKSEDKNHIWCSYVGAPGEKGECGKQCDTYKPRNGVKGACVHLGTLYNYGETVTIRI